MKKSSNEKIETRKINNQLIFRYSPEFQFRLNYAVTPRINIFLSSIIKFRSIGSRRKNLFGEGIGVSYQLKK